VPTVGVFHTNYWEVSSTAGAPPKVINRVGGYPAWQSGVVMGSGMGAIVGLITDWLACLWTVFQGYRRLDGEQRVVLQKALMVMTHPAYPVARLAVRKDGNDLGLQPSRSVERTVARTQGRSEACGERLSASGSVPVSEGQSPE
jgi:hypothetical protein